MTECRMAFVGVNNIPQECVCVYIYIYGMEKKTDENKESCKNINTNGFS